MTSDEQFGAPTWTMGDYVVIFFLTSVALWWWTLLDVALRNSAEWPSTGPSRPAWLCLILIAGAFGSVAYLFAGPPAKLGPRART